MNKRSISLFVVIAFAAGIAGGMISAGFFRLLPVEDKKHKNIIVAHEIHLVDEEGRERWVLSISRDGEPSLTFVNKNGWAPMAMGINKEGLPFLNMILEPGQKEGPSLVMMDSRMDPRIHLGLSEDGEPQLCFLDHGGKTRLALGSAELPNPLTGAVEKRPSSSIALFDEYGQVLWSAPEFKPLAVHLSSAPFYLPPH